MFMYLVSLYSASICSSISMLKEGFSVMLGTSSSDSSSPGLSFSCCFLALLFLKSNKAEIPEIRVTKENIEIAVEIPRTLHSHYLNNKYFQGAKILTSNS